MAVRGPAVLRPSIGKNTTEGDAVLVEEGHDPVIEQIRSSDWHLAIMQLGEADLAIGVDEEVC